jgi:hypothetical protein
MSARVVMQSLAAAMIVATLGASAAPVENEKEPVEVAVIAILATDRNDKVDPKLACIAREVRRSHKELKGFQLATMTRRSLAVGEKSVFKLVDKSEVGVIVQQGADEKNRVQVKLAPPGMGEITYDTCCGKFLPIVTPFRTKNNELLIVAVCVRPCHEK